MVARKNILTKLSWMILAVGVVLTGCFSYYFYASGEREFQGRFEMETNDVLSRIESRLERYELVLLQTRAFLLQQKKLDNEKFQQYFQDARFKEKYPGMQGLGYVRRFSPQVAGVDVTSIVHIAPEDWRNLRALGFDMMTEPFRRAAMEKARDSGRATLSDKVTLMQETGVDPQPGLILYLPIYGKVSPKTTEDRRAQLTGYITSPFRTYDFLGAIFKSMNRLRFNFEIYQGETRDPSSLLYAHHQDLKQKRKTGLEAALVKSIEIYGNAYKVYFYPGPEYFSPVTHWAPLVVATLGILVTLLLMRIFFITQKQMDAKDEFLGVASHELKTPITSLQLQLQMARRSLGPEATELPEPQKLLKSFDSSIHQVRRITRLIDDLLEISRIEKGNLSFTFQETNVTELILELFTAQAELIKAAGNSVEFNLALELLAVCDRFRLEQVILNLLTNAVKYGAGTVIKVTLTGGSDRFIISIRDHGKGIRADLQQKIFEKYQRAEFSKSISGLGLGLYISKQIIQAHQGSIRVVSTVSEGAEFIVELPYQQV
ncbi:MAG TPA: CHASE domain-containing protein [Bacteriovoracaceae bacterium]|nr:CHASE domain-containing protein [Bacteriovoracaceae bacterium]